MSAPRKFELSAKKRAMLGALLQEHGLATDQRIPRRPDLSALPLSFSQQRLWFLDQLQPGTPAYNVPGALRLRGLLSVPALQQSLEEIVRRHQPLRTTFHASDGEACQMVAPSLTVALPVIDLSHLPEAARIQEARRRANEEAQRAFDLSKGPMLRTVLLHLAPDDHVLLLTAHHIVSDAWSIAVFTRELAALYDAFATGQAPDLPELPIEYADFAHWQRQRLAGALLDAQLAYWRKALNGVPRFQMPTDRPRVDEQSFKGKTETLVIPRELRDGLKAFSQREGATLFMTLLAAFEVMLYRYTGQTDFAIGSPIANRNRSEIEPLIGFFVNSLAIRADVSNAPSFRELLDRVQQTVLGAFANQDLPFEKLVEEIRPERELSQNPFFQIMFALQNAPAEALTLTGLGIETFDTDLRATRFDIELHTWETAEGLAAVIFYRTDLFDRATIVRMLKHYERLLTAVVEQPERSIDELPMLTGDERDQILREWNPSGPGFPDEPIHRLFEARAADTPDAASAVYGDRQMTYGELNRKANQLAHTLRGRGVGPDTIVGIFVERSLDMLVGMLGILKAGGAYLPLDTVYPANRLALMIDDSGARVLLTQQHLLDRLPRHEASPLCLDRDWPEIAEASSENLGVAVTPEHLAYVIYTSGSTGQPKGAAIPHRGVVRLVLNTDYVALDRSDRIAQASNASFDAATFEIWGALLLGGCLIGIEKDLALSPVEFATELRDRRVTTLFLTTALFNLMAREAPWGFSGLRHLLFGGEAVDPSAVRDALRQGRPERLLHVYGPTENTTYSSWHLVDLVPEDATTVPIGGPIGYTQLYVLDDLLQPVPAGVPGELYVGGDGVARGYLNAPAQTAAKFIPDPFRGVPGARMYRTGDTVRWLASGDVEFIGRRDSQVKIRGFRIEPGEIESVLSKHPSVRDAVVLAREDTPGNRRLVAYVVPHSVSSSPESSDAAWNDARVEQWRKVYDDVIYEGVAPDASDDPTFNITGWASSYTGLPIPADAMREQVEQSVSRILSSAPKRVLEIGCGTGLLLFRIASSCETYLGTDFSRVSLDYVKARLPANLRGRVQLSERMADDFSGIADGSFDAVVLNSVVQYFPDGDYLRRVLSGAIRALAPGGRLFVGDVRNLALLEAFHTAVAVFQASDHTDTSALRARIAQRLEQEQELLVAPAFFQSLAAEHAAVTGVAIFPKRGQHRHELSEFRYDAVLEVGGAGPEPASAEWREWPTGWTADDLRALLADEKPEAIGWHGVPNARVQQSVLAIQHLTGPERPGTVQDLRAATRDAHAIDPETLWVLAEASSYCVDLSWADGRADGAFDVLFRRAAPANPPMTRLPRFPEPPAIPASIRLTNNPSKGTIARGLVPELRSYLSDKLPDYMVPSSIMLLESLPITPNGKVDRRALPAPDQSRPETSETYSSPRNEVEAKLAAIWSDVLRVETVGVEDSFFELGGHSLLATQVISRVRSAFNLDLPLRSLFEAPTIAGLGAAVEAARQARDHEAKSRIVRTARDGSVPLSFAQQRLWFLHQLDPAGWGYNMPSALALQGRLNVAALEASLREIVRRHETLRVKFVAEGGLPVQRLVPPTAFPLQRVDLGDLPAADRPLVLRRLVADDARQPFDLTSGSLIRATLVRLGADDHALLLTMHHIASDGWSLNVFTRELAALYEAFVDGRPSPLDELPVQYADFAAWQRQWLEGEVLKEQLGWWTRHLDGLNPLQLPTDRPHPAVQTFNGAFTSTVVPKGVADTVRELSQREGVTLFMTLLAAFQTLLHRYTAQDDIVVGTPIANRNRAETEGLIGVFVNSLVMRSDLSGDPTFHELLTRVREMTLAAYARQDLPFERLVEALHPTRDLSRNPLFQVLFAVQNAPVDPLTLSGLTISPLDVSSQEAKVRVDLELHVWERADGLGVLIGYNTDLFDGSTADRMLRHFQNLLEDLSARPQKRLSEAVVLTSDELKQLVLWNDTDAIETALCLPAMFEAQVERTPDAIAVSYGDDALTYAELNRRANQLARYLMGLGVGGDALVGVMTERSPLMLVALLGVLKAGGAYVPLDAAYPAERLAFMLADAGVTTLLTERALRDTIPGHGCRVVALDSDWSAIEQEPGTNLPAASRPENLAYVIYTSGSTGRPKGVQVPHRALANFLVSMRRQPGIGSGDVLLSVTTLSFDIAGLELYLPLIAGARVALVSRETAADGHALAREISRSGATLMQATPATWRLLVATGWRGSKGLTALCGGEALPGDLASQIRDRCAGLWNLYGPTETTIWSTIANLSGDGAVTIGGPIRNTEVHVLDAWLQPVPVGVSGELFIGGAGVARGYRGRPDLTAERFVPDALSGRAGARLYRTGDLVRRLPDGNIEYVGRTDHQIKLRGYRIELGEIEAVLSEQQGVDQAVAMVREDRAGDRRLVAYLVARGPAVLADVKRSVSERLPQYMAPSAYVFLDAFPLTPNGKVDRRSLPAPEGERQAEGRFVAPSSELEAQIVGVWREVLGLENVGVCDNFFDLGGHSLLIVQAHARLVEVLGRSLSIIELFQFPTIETLARHLSPEAGATALAARAKDRASRRSVARDADAIAVVGMAGRFPGARDLEAFWNNLVNGVESIRTFTDDELRAAGLDESLLSNPRYVRSRGTLDDIELFDASFFGFTPREAELLDPQQRLFLEVAWEALERAACDPRRFEGLIGVYAGSSINSYAMSLRSDANLMQSSGVVEALMSSDKDHLPTRVSYKLNLRGPSVSIQTACSTSLVAIHTACRSLANYECDMALAGGVSIQVPAHLGVVYEDGGIVSPDGHCRTFDRRAAGTVSGSGVGVVALKRLADALEDGDPIHAVVRGSAINNDGALKVGYTAPSVEGQAEAVALAHAVAGVSPDTIGYIEAHGTATPLGDPIEVRALTQVFRERTESRGFCALGSVKTNIGHLDAAAGVAGFIKTVLALERREIPPSLHFEEPNAEIDFAGSPFFVNTARRSWIAPNGGIRRAAVSSFGLGGTNAHAVLEEAHTPEPSGPSRDGHTLILSAKTQTALERAITQLADYLECHPESQLADVAHTLQVGRQAFDYRWAAHGRTVVDAVAALRGAAPRRVVTSKVTGRRAGVVFMFPGQGAQHVGMARSLYASERIFKEAVDACASRFLVHLGEDIRTLLCSATPDDPAAAEHLTQTARAQAALFTVEYALAQLWMSRGIQPAALIGHSIGEYVAACVSGALDLDDAIRLVGIRGRLMAEAPDGVMLSVALSESRAQEFVGDGVWLAAVNAPAACVLAGVPERVAALERKLEADGVPCQRLQTSGAFHSGLMRSAAEQLTETARQVRPREIRIPYVSNLTGQWIGEQDLDAGYWGRHVEGTVQFRAGIETLVQWGAGVFLEVGPGQALTGLARQKIATLAQERTPAVIASLRHVREDLADPESLARATGQLWVYGIEPDWNALYAGERRRRVELPTYPFERKRFWIDPQASVSTSPSVPPGTGRLVDMADWFFIPSWKRTVLPAAAGDPAVDGVCALVFTSEHDAIGVGVCEELVRLGHRVVRVDAGSGFEHAGPDRFVVAPGSRQDFTSLIEALRADRLSPRFISHFWGLGTSGVVPASLAADEDASFYSFVSLVQALAEKGFTEPARIDIVTAGVFDVTGTEPLAPARALAIGPARVIPDEVSHLSCRHFDVVVPEQGGVATLVKQLVTEIRSTGPDSADNVIAYRAGHRWVQQFEPARIGGASAGLSRVRERGVYLITGGLGAVGLAFAEHFARRYAARLVLVGRSALPPRSEWPTLARADGGGADGVARRIAAVQALEAAGAEVMTIAADVADPRAMEQAVERAIAGFGRIDGVIHAAGIAGGGLIELKTRSAMASVLAPKVAGTRALEHALAGRHLDFLILCSSINAIHGGLGQVDYCAANAYLDGFAASFARATGTFTVAVNWDTWREGGMAVDSHMPDAWRRLREESLKHGLTNAEGVEALERVLAAGGLTQVVVSPRGLGTSARRKDPARSAVPDAAAAVASGHERPALEREYVAPRNDIEEIIAGQWSALFGIARIGIDDNFFELGGHSLLATQLASRLRQTFQIDLPLAVMFEALTIAEQSDLVLERLLEQQVGQGASPLLAEISNLSQDDVRRQLAAPEAGSGTPSRPN